MYIAMHTIVNLYPGPGISYDYDYDLIRFSSTTHQKNILRAKRLVARVYIDVTFTTWFELNRRSGRACGHSPGPANVQHCSPAEISKGSFASFTVDLQH